MHYMEHIEKYFATLTSTLHKIDSYSLANVIKIIEVTVKNNHTIYTMGNGGSASTASHMQNDLGNVVAQINGQRVKIHCLSDNISTITAIANDYAYDMIYLRQLQGVLEEGDLLIVISGSGNSQNIINAVGYARSVKANVIAMTGYDGGVLKNIANYNLNVPIDNMQISEDVHLIFNHLITHILHTVNRGL